MRRSSTRLLGAAIAVSSLTAACGLSSNAVQDLRTSSGSAGLAGGTGQTGTGGVGGTGGGGLGTGGVGGTGAGGTGGGTSGVGGTGGVGGVGGTGGAGGSGGGGSGGGGGGGHGGGGGGGTQSPSGRCGVPTGGDSTGVTASTINLGLHAPLTGTGTPFPNTSFKAGANTFWQQAGHTVCGRKVSVEFQDDTYTPSGARTVCSAMAKRDFFVIGGGGTDQIQACATEPTIQRLGVPYLSAGVTDNGLTNLSNYFAVSLSYQQQGSLVLRNAANQHFSNPSPSRVASDNIKGKNASWAIVTGGSPNFEGARRGIEAALNKAHIPYKSYPVNQNGNYQAAATQFGSQLALQGFKTIFVDAAPGYFVFMTGGYYSASTGNNANWVGPGVTYTEVTVAQLICDGTKSAINGHAWFLAPAPGIDRATADFKKAYNGKYDDIEWGLWGLSNSLFALLKNASNNLTRQNFIAATTHATVPGSVYAPLDFAHHGGHFGGTGAWVQRVNCRGTEPNQNQAGQWDTVGSTYLRLY
ncbi:MAG: hypothetical protein JO246_10370 [Frankiaceae bacterium]|nr:hypothetical protein [Frankiaceae bacterium]